MVLFTMEHIGSLWLVLLFRYKIHKDESAVLFTLNMYKDFEFLNNMKKEGIFTNIIYYSPKYRRDQLLNRDWEKQIDEDYDNMFENIDLSISDFSYIYCTFDISNDFSIYATRNGIVHNYIESGIKDFREEKYSILTNAFNGDAEHERITRKYDALLGLKNPYVKKRYVWERESEKDVMVDFIEEFFGLGDDAKRVLAKCLKQVGVPKGQNISVFFMNSWGWTCGRAKVKIEDLYLVYALIIDIYLSDVDNLWIKDHPINIQVEKYASRSGLFKYNSIDRTVPIELLSFCMNLRFNKVISCNSTSNFKLRKYVEQNIVLGDEAFYFWQDLIKMFVTYDIQKYIGERFKNYYYGVNRNLLINYIKATGNLLENNEPMGINPSILKGKIFTIIGRVGEDDKEKINFALCNADEDTTVIIWNYNRNSFQLDVSLMEFLLVVRIEKRLKGYSIINSSNEYIGIFSKSRALRSKVKKYYLIKELANSKCDIEASVISYEDLLKSTNKAGTDISKIPLDKILMIPGFSVEKYRKLLESKLTILSMNCFGGIVSHTLGLRFYSPTINMYFSEEDYIKFLKNLRWYLKQDLIKLADGFNQDLKISYPICKLGDITIHMNHYGDFKEAKQKWEERLKRINMDDICAIMYTDDMRLLKEFDSLSYKKKACFTTVKTNLKSAFFLDSRIDGNDKEQPLWWRVNKFAEGKFWYYDIFDLLTEGKKTPLFL